MANKNIAIAGGNLEYVLNFIRSGGRVFVQTPLRVTYVDKKVLARFEKAGAWILKEEGEGYRMASGKSSVYLMPGQLQAESA